MARAKNYDEKLDDVSIERVIKYLSEKGATKKVACQMLNIAYNTSRLDKLIETFKTKREQDALRRAEKRGKPATKEEISYIITEYLNGATLDSISKSLYRGTTLIKNILEEYSVPQRASSPDYFRPELIPDGAVSEGFLEGETVYSARYDCLAKVIKEVPCSSGKAYSIWLNSDRYREFAYQPVWELASLRRLREAGIPL